MFFLLPLVGDCPAGKLEVSNCILFFSQESYYVQTLRCFPAVIIIVCGVNRVILMDRDVQKRRRCCALNSIRERLRAGGNEISKN